jgi:hypothetical protein
MSVNNDLERIIEEVDLLVAELRELNEEGPHFRIVHRFHTPGTHCAPGEEIAGIYLVHRGREYHLRLSLALRLLFDYLARHSHLPQSATQIEAGIRAERFYTEHAASMVETGKLTRSIPRSYVKVYIERLGIALKCAFHWANLELATHAALITEETVMNEVGYRLKGVVEWFHIDL